LIYFNEVFLITIRYETAIEKERTSVGVTEAQVK